jgi:hypothetical protein
MIGTIRWDEVIAVGIVIWCVGMLIYLRSVRTPEVVLGTIVVAILFATYWLAPHPVYVAALIVCPLLWIAYLLYSRGVW